MSRTEHVLFSETKIATAPVKEQRFVGYDGTQATVLGQDILGVAHTDAEIGDAYGVSLIGIVSVYCASAIAIGGDVATDATGAAIPPAVAADFIIGKAFEAGVAGQMFQVLIR
ncbi:MAG: DUF2190 family protein [Rhizobiales bacterium]|nr:DUF2190 family protein [Hyphomicrobiales bacterium]